MNKPASIKLIFKGIHMGTDYLETPDDGRFHMLSFDFAEASKSRLVHTKVNPSVYRDMYDNWVMPGRG